MRKAKLAAIPILVLLMAACTSWEKQTYQTLAASKASIDTAADQYNAGTLPQTQQVHDLITKARQAQTMAVDAFKQYLFLKTASVPQQQLTDQQAAVTAAVGQVATLIADIKTLGGK